mmetsp:Transcript_45794/g.139125  ORF Transcript_45794/g.139125 Transcript_45794/m.139125 type:complete len:207 (-) Transcript_45794:854-1474(-)
MRLRRWLRLRPSTGRRRHPRGLDGDLPLSDQGSVRRRRRRIFQPGGKHAGRAGAFPRSRLLQRLRPPRRPGRPCERARHRPGAARSDRLLGARAGSADILRAGRGFVRFGRARDHVQSKREEGVLAVVGGGGGERVQDAPAGVRVLQGPSAGRVADEDAGEQFLRLGYLLSQQGVVPSLPGEHRPAPDDDQGGVQRRVPERPRRHV